MTDERLAEDPSEPASAPAPDGAAGWGEASSRTVRWHDPATTARLGLTLPGIDYLRAMGDGTLPPPPIAQLIGMEFVSVQEGEIEFRCTPDASTYNPLGIVHGGLVCTALDSAAGCAVHTLLPAGVGYTSMEIKVNYLRAAHAGTPLTIKGWVTKPGRRVAFAEAEVTGPDGKAIANATSTLLILTPGA